MKLVIFMIPVGKQNTILQSIFTCCLLGIELRFFFNKYLCLTFSFNAIKMLSFCFKISSDASLSCYNVIVLDEVHERHLHGDYLLGVIKCLLQHRDDLRNGVEWTLRNFLSVKYYDYDFINLCFLLCFIIIF